MSILNRTELGCWFALSVMSWSETPPCTLPIDDSMLALLANTGSTEWGAMRGRIIPLLGREVGGRLQTWLIVRYEESAAYLAQKRASASKGGSTAQALLKQRSSTARPSLDPPVPVPVPVHAHVLDPKPKTQNTDAAHPAVSAAKPANPAAGPPDGLWGLPRWGIRFDPNAREFVGITDYDRAKWADTFPAVDLDGEIRKAAEWCKANAGGRKSNYRKYLTGWLTRAQDQGGSKPSNRTGFAKPPGETHEERRERIMAEMLKHDAERNGSV